MVGKKTVVEIYIQPGIPTVIQGGSHAGKLANKHTGKQSYQTGRHIVTHAIIYQVGNNIGSI